MSGRITVNDLRKLTLRAIVAVAKAPGSVPFFSLRCPADPRPWPSKAAEGLRRMPGTLRLPAMPCERAISRSQDGPRTHSGMFTGLCVTLSRPDALAVLFCPLLPGSVVKPCRTFGRFSGSLLSHQGQDRGLDRFGQGWPGGDDAGQVGVNFGAFGGGSTSRTTSGLYF
jgi:hypothetical protein